MTAPETAVHTLHEAGHSLIVRRPDGSAVFTLAPADRVLAEQIVANLNGDGEEEA